MYPDAIAEIAKEIEDVEARMEFGEGAARVGFALALTFARQEQGMTQEELANLLGVREAYVVRLESGEANPSIAKAGRIFAALWLTPIDKPFPLLRGYGPYEPPRGAASEAGAEPTGEESTRKAKR